MKRGSYLIGFAAVLLALAAGCELFWPPEPPGQGERGFAVPVTVGGIGSAEARSLFADTNVAEVIVTAYDSSRVQVGSGSLAKGGSAWQGVINVSRIGRIDFEAAVNKAGHIPLYAGVLNATLTTGSEGVSIGVTKILAAEWLFGGNANDTGGGGIHGTVYGDTTTVADRFARAGNAFLFDGNGDYVMAAADTLPAGARTVSLWFYADAISEGMGVLGYGGNGTDGTSWWQNLKLAGESKYTVGAHGSGNSLQADYTAEPVGRWIHWVAVTDAGGTRLYVDGALAASNASLSILNTATTGRSICLGGIVDSSGAGPLVDSGHGTLNGRLDDVRIYNCALTAAQVTALYRETGWPVPDDGLVGEWMMEGSAADTSGNGNDGTVTNAVPAADRFGVPDRCYSFDGNGDYIGVTGLAGTYVRYAVSFWLQSAGTAFNASPTVIRMGGNSFLRFSNNTQTPLDAYVDGTLKGTATLSVGAWHHVAATCDGSSFVLYVDGQQAVSGTAALFTMDGFQIGANSASSHYYYGLMDDVRFYGRGLDADEVAVLYHEGGWAAPLSEPDGYPTSFACGSPTKTSLGLSWTDAAGAVAPEGYLIKWSAVGYGSIAAPVDGTAEPDGAGVKNVAQGAQAVTLSGLQSATTYYFRIWPYTNSGYSKDYKLGAPPEASGATGASEPTGYPTSFSSASAAPSSLTLTWADASGAVPPEYYLIKWSSVGYTSIADPVDGTAELDGAGAKNIGQGVQTCTLTGLASATTCYFKIWPYTVSGSQRDYKTGSEPQIAAATTATEPTNHPTSFAFGSATVTSITLTWTDATGAVTPEHYLVKWSSVGYGSIADPVDGTAESDGAGKKNVAQGVQTCTLTGLASSTTYYFKIWAYTSSGSLLDYKQGSEPQTSGATTATEPTNHPTSFACASSTVTSLTVSWTDATGAVTPEHYLIKWSTVGYGSIAEPADGTAESDGAGVKNVAQGVQTYALSGLGASTTCYFKIWPYTSSGSQLDYKLGSEPQLTAVTKTAAVMSSGTSWTVPAGVTSIKVWAVGAGGGGAGAGHPVSGGDTTAGGGGGSGGTAYRTFTVTEGQTVSYSLGTAGTGGNGQNNGNTGGDTTCTVGGTTITGNGGGGGYHNLTTAGSGGSWSGGDGGLNGGTGIGASGDTGGGGGGGIGGANAPATSSSGGTGAQSANVSGLFAALSAAGCPTNSPGTGGGTGSSDNAMHGTAATGFGCGGGGAGWYGGNGGAGLYGGGGAGAGGGHVAHDGGAGGQGAVVIEY